MELVLDDAVGKLRVVVGHRLVKGSVIDIGHRVESGLRIAFYLDGDGPGIIHLRPHVDKHRVPLALDVVDKKLVHAPAIGIEGVGTVEIVLAQQFLGPDAHDIPDVGLRLAVDVKVAGLRLTAVFQRETIDIHEVGVGNKKLHGHPLAVEGHGVVVASVKRRSHRCRHIGHARLPPEQVHERADGVGMGVVEARYHQHIVLVEAHRRVDEVAELCQHDEGAAKHRDGDDVLEDDEDASQHHLGLMDKGALNDFDGFNARSDDAWNEAGERADDKNEQQRQADASRTEQPGDLQRGVELVSHNRRKGHSEE